LTASGRRCAVIFVPGDELHRLPFHAPLRI
jgi:hypothetical protein